MIQNPQTLIGVIGVGQASEQEQKWAYEVGKLIAEQDFALICGGLSGVMEAASQGCSEAGGTVIGILPGPEKKAANPYVTFALPTNLGQARNVLIAQSADLLIAIGKGYGTLSEIALGLKLGKPVLSFHSWEIPGVKLCRKLGEVEKNLRAF